MPELPCVYCHAPSVIAAVSSVPEALEISAGEQKRKFKIHKFEKP